MSFTHFKVRAHRTSYLNVLVNVMSNPALLLSFLEWFESKGEVDARTQATHGNGGDDDAGSTQIS